MESAYVPFGKLCIYFRPFTGLDLYVKCVGQIAKPSATSDVWHVLATHENIALLY